MSPKGPRGSQKRGSLATATFTIILNPGLVVSNHDRANREVKWKININRIDRNLLRKETSFVYYTSSVHANGEVATLDLCS